MQAQGAGAAPQGVRVVTPEAVVLDVRTAGLGSWALARALDGLIQFVVLTVFFIVMAFFGGGVVVAVVLLAVLTMVVLGYPIVWEWLWRGRTPGKAALGLRVVTREGAPIRFRHAAVRGILGLLEVTLLPVVGVLSMLVSRNDQRLGDLAAGTIVIRERATGRSPAPVVFYPPPGWESFVASLDVSGMAPAEYGMVRSFLLRARRHGARTTRRTGGAAGGAVGRSLAPGRPGRGWPGAVVGMRGRGVPATPRRFVGVGGAGVAAGVRVGRAVGLGDAGAPVGLGSAVGLGGARCGHARPRASRPRASRPRARHLHAPGLAVAAGSLRGPCPPISITPPPRRCGPRRRPPCCPG